jgi:hypothetical protein
MAIKSPKSKGASGEREAAAILEQWGIELGYVLDISRNLEQTRGGGYDLDGVEGLAIEIKRVESNSINSWWKQTLGQAEKKNEVPFLMHRKNRQPWSFRVRSRVAMDCEGRWELVVMDIDLTLDQGKLWFQAYLRVHVKKDY